MFILFSIKTVFFGFVSVITFFAFKTGQYSLLIIAVLGKSHSSKVSKVSDFVVELNDSKFQQSNLDHWRCFFRFKMFLSY